MPPRLGFGLWIGRRAGRGGGTGTPDPFDQGFRWQMDCFIWTMGCEFYWVMRDC